MTPEENRALDALNKVSMRIGSGGKRFRREMLWQREHTPDFKLTAGQAIFLWELVDLYRRQIPDEQLKGWGAHTKLTAELPPIYSAGDHREKKQPKKGGSKQRQPAPAPQPQRSPAENSGRYIQQDLF